MPDEPRRKGRPPLDLGGPSVPVHLTLAAREYDALYQRAARERVSVPEQIRRELGHAREWKEQVNAASRYNDG
jgi:hypothetical protein